MFSILCIHIPQQENPGALIKLALANKVLHEADRSAEGVWEGLCIHLGWRIILSTWGEAIAAVNVQMKQD